MKGSVISGQIRCRRGSTEARGGLSRPKVGFVRQTGRSRGFLFAFILTADPRPEVGSFCQTSSDLGSVLSCVASGTSLPLSPGLGVQFCE